MRFVLAIFAVAAMLAFASHSAQAGGEGVIRVGFYPAEVGEQVTVVLEAVDIPEPGLGAWVVDVIYDSAIVHATGCSSEQGGVCSPAFADDTVRATGAVVTEGLTGTFPLATFTFACDAVGTSELEVDEVLFTTAEPQLEIDDLSLDNGSITCEEAGQDGIIRIGSYEALVGDEVTTTLEAVDIPPPGLGAWTVDITYDSSVVTAIDCEALGNSVCSPLFMDDTVRSTGASATGLEGTLSLAKFGFKCDVPGVSDLTLQLSIFTDAAFPPQVLIPEIEDGFIICTEPPGIEPTVPPPQLPSTGIAEPRPASPPAAVPLALLGVVLLAAAFAFRRYASPR